MEHKVIKKVVCKNVQLWVYLGAATHLHVDFTEPLCDVNQLLLDLLAGPLRRLQASSQLLHLRLHEAQTALLETVLLPQLIMLTGVLVHLHLQILHEERDQNTRIIDVVFSVPPFAVDDQIKILL